MSKITQIDNFDSILEQIPNLEDQTLFILDIDEVIIMPTEEYRLTHPNRVRIIKEYKNKYSFEERKLLFSIIMHKQKMRLVDENILEVFESLKNYKVHTIGLTKSFTNKFGIVDSVENILLERLSSLGVSFENLTPVKEDFIISVMASDNGTPIFRSGILMTALRDKGETLNYLFNKTNYFPKKIIFIDDKRENLESLNKLCTTLGIEGHFYEYSKASKIPFSNLNSVNEELRFKILENEHQWLNDQELQQYERKIGGLVENLSSQN